MLIYDKIDWHYGADDFPRELDDKSAGTHIGLFLTWIINNNLLSESLATNSLCAIAKVKSREITGIEFLQNNCDGMLSEDDLNKVGNKFAKFYYESGEYYKDYADSLANDCDTIYHVEDTWGNYDKLSKYIDEKFYNLNPSKRKKLWQFWR